MFENLRRGYVSLAYAISFVLFAALTGFLLSLALQHGAPSQRPLEVERAPTRDYPFFREEPAPEPAVKAAPLDPPPRVAPPVISGPGFPAMRVKPQHLAENRRGSPEAYLTEGRIVLRDFHVETVGAGMRISGRVWSDFEVEDGHGFAPGQLMGLEIEIGLHEIRTDMDDKLGADVPTQSCQCKVSGTEQSSDITLGTAAFSLPEMAKPLPPGAYRLVCKIAMNKLDKDLQNALMWVRDLYGVTPVYEADGHPTGETRDIYKSKDHKPAWKDMTENEVCKSQGTLFFGNALTGGGTKIDASNTLCRGAEFEVYKNLTILAKQRKLLDDEYQKDKQKGNPKNKDSYEQSVRELDVLVARTGGKMGGEEYRAYAKTLASMAKLREAIIKFEDDLTLKYWIVLDTFYYDLHTVNKAGYNCHQAIEKGDNTLDRDAREKQGHDSHEARDATRQENFKYIPEAIRRAAFAYYQRSEETELFDSASYTNKRGDQVELDPEKWSAFRVEFVAEFRERSGNALNSVDVSREYFIQKWGDVFAQVQRVRDAIIVLCYVYEHYLRMLPLEKEFAKNPDDKEGRRNYLKSKVLDDWSTEAGNQRTELKPYFEQAFEAPSATFGRFEAAWKQAKHLLAMPDFAYRYRLNIDKREVPPPRRFKSDPPPQPEDEPEHK